MESLCRACLKNYDNPTDLLQYCESNRRLFVYCTGLQVKRNDTFTFQLCKECYLNMKLSCKFKKQCRNSDKKFKNYLALKKTGEHIDFCDYLKNVEDTFSFRFPLMSRSSTPSHQQTEDDDDNVSTCTSIQNFMTDMLQGEEMAPTEARIIREVIQEEADILDDSLDSHWLQDDDSVDNDLGMDFNFCGFSTPRSVNNDCYTSRRLTADDKEFSYYSPKKTVATSIGSQVVPKNDMPILDDVENDIAPINAALPTDMPLLDESDVEFDGGERNRTLIESENDYCMNNIKERDKNLINIKGQSQDSDIFLQSKVAEISTHDPFKKLGSLNDSLFPASNDCSSFAISNTITLPNKDIAPNVNENGLSINTNKEIAANNFTYSPLTRELELSLDKVEFTRNHIKSNGNEVCKKNEDNMYLILNQNKVDNIINQSPLTHEIEQYINKTKVNKIIESETSSNDKVISYLNGDTNSVSIVQKTELHAGNVDCEIDHYINKAKLKKRNNLVSDASNTREHSRLKCPIDRNLELALRNDESQEFSLDQLLISPQVSIQSGASTPTINNILFGGMTPKDTDVIVESRGISDSKLEPADFVGEFLKDNQCNRQSTLKEELKYDENKITEIQTNNEHKEHNPKKHNQIRGFKDIKKLRKLLKTDCGDQTIESDDDTTNLLKESNKIKEKDNESKTDLASGVIDDLDISISNLINFDDSKSIDLNISISSDFLHTGENENDDTEKDNLDDPFKRPFSPPDNKYDLENFICKICDKKYGSLKALKLHFIKLHKVQLYTKKKAAFIPSLCPHCGELFNDKSNLNRHLRKHNGIEIYRCKLCTLPFSTQGRLSLHMRAHHNEIARKEKNDAQKKSSLIYRCKFCSVAFLIEAKLTEHIRINHADAESNGSDIEENEKSESSSHDKKYICGTCGKASSTISNLRKHQRRHTKSYSVTCQTCHLGFYSNNELQRHLGTHNDTFSFRCEYCPKRYNRRDLLMKHVYKHLIAGNNVLTCDGCKTHFANEAILKIHIDNMCRKTAALPKDTRETPKQNAKSTKNISEIMENEKPEESNQELDITDQIKPSKISESISTELEVMKMQPIVKLTRLSSKTVQKYLTK